jgi:hypothetical protein
MPLVVALLLSLSTAQAAPPCGEQGTLAERVSDCQARTETAGLPSGWRWVTLTSEHEITQDTRTGLLWARRSRSASLYSLAAASCSELSVSDTPDAPITFEIPSMSEVRPAFDAGLTSALGLPWDQIWTSTRGKSPGEHWAFDLWGGVATLLRLPLRKQVLPRLLAVCVGHPGSQSPRPDSISAGVR